jgi:hypothetical protein
MQNDINEEISSKDQSVPTEASSVQTETSSVVPQQEPKKKSKVLTVVVISVLVLLFLGGAVYAAYNYFGFSEGDTPQPESFEEEDFEFESQSDESSPIPVYSEYVGEYITAELPDGWEIVEYENGEGSDMLAGGTEYIGLTGISVLTDQGEEVFQTYAVMGIGGVSICYEVEKFSDTPQTYIQKINELTTEHNSYVLDPEPMPVVNQIGDSEYTDIFFLEYRGRRVGTTLYWNDPENVNEEEFHPLCGIYAEALMFEYIEFGYGDSGGYDFANTYGMRIIGNPSEQVLLMLDEVVSSITLKN